MNVIFNLPSIPRYLNRFEMLKCLSQMVDELIVVTNDSGQLKSQFDNARLQITMLPKKRLPFLISTITEKNILDADIIHDTFGYFLPLGILHKLKGRSKYVTSVYGSSVGWLEKAAEINYQNKDEIKQKHYMAFRESVNARLSDFIFVNCENFKNDYINYYRINPRKIEIISNSVIINDNICSQAQKKEGEPFRILHIGNISKIKGSLLLIKAFNQLVMEKHAVELIVIGKPLPYDLNYLSNLTSSGLKLLGHVPEDKIIDHCMNADVLIHPSYQEGMPRVVMEALSYGLPVIASDLPGIRAIDNSGRFIKLMKDFQVDSLQQLIINEINQPRKSESFFHEARKHMGQFSPENTASRIYKIYNQFE